MVVFQPEDGHFIFSLKHFTPNGINYNNCALIKNSLLVLTYIVFWNKTHYYHDVSWHSGPGCSKVGVDNAIHWIKSLSSG